MEARARHRRSFIRLAAFATPCLAGLAYLTLFAAPFSFVLINAGALALGLAWIVVGRAPEATATRRGLALALLVVLALPLLVGPSVDGAARWLSLAGFSLHAGMLVIPLLVTLAATDRVAGPFLLAGGIVIAFLQPDTASTLALALASLALWLRQRGSWVGVIGVLGLFAALGASFGGSLPPQPFVEGIFGNLSANSTVMAWLLGAAIAIGLGLAAKIRLALGAAMLGFTLAAMIGDYPYPLIGYGAAAIVGLALALADRTNTAR